MVVPPVITQHSPTGNNGYPVPTAASLAEVAEHWPFLPLFTSRKYFGRASGASDFSITPPSPSLTII
jgi:hypothetical protein